MGFDDLEAAEREHNADDESAEATEQPSAEAATETPTDAESGASDEASADQPGFEFDDVKQSPMYARPEAWAELEDALDLEVVRELRETGIRNEAKRELHDAVLRVAARHPEEIADAVRDARRDD